VNTLKHAATTCDNELVHSLYPIQHATHLKLKLFVFGAINFVRDELAQIGTNSLLPT
jgi:hypothetical protein